MVLGSYTTHVIAEWHQLYMYNPKMGFFFNSKQIVKSNFY